MVHLSHDDISKLRARSRKKKKNHCCSEQAFDSSEIDFILCIYSLSFSSDRTDRSFFIHSVHHFLMNYIPPVDLEPSLFAESFIDS